LREQLAELRLEEFASREAGGVLDEALALARRQAVAELAERLRPALVAAALARVAGPAPEAATSEPTGLYAYAITRAGDLDLTGAEGVAGGTPRLVTHAGLGLVVSEVRLSELDDLAGVAGWCVARGDALTAPLADVVEGVRRLEVHEPYVDQVALLVRTDRLAEADAAVGDLATRADDARIEYVGPLPVFTFLDELGLVGRAVTARRRAPRRRFRLSSSRPRSTRRCSSRRSRQSPPLRWTPRNRHRLPARVRRQDVDHPHQVGAQRGQPGQFLVEFVDPVPQ
jgi:hypothetical protein